MTAVVVAILSLTVLGLPVALAVDRSSRGPLLLGTAFLYGSGAIYLVLLGLSVLHIPWTVVTLAIAALLPWAALWFIPRQPTTDNRQLNFHWLDIPTLLTLIGFAFYCTLAPMWEWDFWAIWGLKARVFLEHGGIDWQFLESRWNAWVHPDYPLLVTLNFDFVALLNGGWSDRWLGALSFAWAVALVLIVRGLAAREASTVPAAVVTLAVVPIAASRYVGLGEGPLIAFGAAGVLLAWRALRLDDAAAWRHAALLLGFAACVKNEGVALLVSVTIAVLILRARDVMRLWPAFAVVVPWIILRATHDLPTDIATGSVVGRVLYRMPYSAEIFLFLMRWMYHPFFWAALLAGLLILPARARREQSFILLVTAVQFGFYVGSYYATPHDARWHVAASWSRLTEQIAIPITYAVVLMLAKYIAAVEESPDAEARPVER
jgi:hypothetical protein